MPVLIVRSERSLNELRHRIVGRTGARELPDHVVDALRKANPQVDLDDLRPGTVLTVPDVEGVRVRDDAAPRDLLDQGLDVMLDRLGDVVGSLDSPAQAQAKDAAADRATVTRSLGLKAVQEAARGDQDLAAALGRVEEALGAADADAKRDAKVQRESVAAWMEDLASLDALKG